MGRQSLNYANIAAFLLNALATYGIAFFPGTQTNDVLSVKYQTLVTPAGYAFAIWAIIFTSEFVFSVAQLFGTLSDDSRARIGWNFVGANLAQTVWNFLFAYEYVELSAVAMFAIWFFLLKIVLSPTRQQEEGSYWLLKFPIDVHAGWISAAFFVNANVLLVKYKASSAVQLGAAVFSLVALVIAAGGFVLKLRNLTMGLVLVWAVAGIAVELGSPKDLISQFFTADAVSAIRSIAIAGGSIIGAIIIGSLFKDWKKPAAEDSQPESQPLLDEQPE